MASQQLWPPAVPTPLDYFRTLVARDAGLPLLEAATAIAHDVEPQLDIQAVLDDVETLADVLRRRLPPDAPSLHKLQRLNHYFFQDLGFAGNLNHYYDPSNSHVHHVLRTRRGIPITLAILYVEMAQHIGLRARGISFPGHFLIKVSLNHGDQRGEVMVDPLTGRSLSRETLDDMLTPYKQQHSELERAQIPLEFFLRTASARDILARMLRNLKEIHTTACDWPALLAVSNRLVVLMPDATEERRDRAMPLEALGCWSQAAEDLQAYWDDAGPQNNATTQQALLARLTALRDRADNTESNSTGEPPASI
jgi:regulator of sirC expression with transglutaminase-like and TPR domain